MQNEYEETLKESRSGIIIDQDEINYLNSILTPLIKETWSINSSCSYK